MIDHISIGVRDIARTKRFYDAALKPLGYKCLGEGEGSLGYGKDAVTLWISSTDRPVPADPKSGLHFCFVAPTPRSIEAFHAAALSNGGRDNGTPGLRTDYSPIIMRPLSSIPTAIGSRRIAAVPQHDPRNLRSRFKNQKGRLAPALPCRRLLDLFAVSRRSSCRADCRGRAERTCRRPPWRSRAAVARWG